MHISVTILSTPWNGAVYVIFQALNFQYSGVRYVSLMKQQCHDPLTHSFTGHRRNLTDPQ
jgi:hypothetical protein